MAARERENEREPTEIEIIRRDVEKKDKEVEIIIERFRKSIRDYGEGYLALDKALRDMAYFLYESSGYEPGRAWDFWLDAEKSAWSAIQNYFHLFTEAPAVTSFLPLRYEDFIARFGNAFSPTAYVETVRDVAYHMWISSGRPSWARIGDTLVAAQKHVLAIMSAAIKTTSSAVEVAQALVGAFATFSPSQHLEYIRRHAYALWESRGRQDGHALDDWLQAEQQILEKIASGQHTHEQARSDITQSAN